MQLSDPLWHVRLVRLSGLSSVLITPDISVVDAGQAGEGNLEILVTAASGINIPTRVEPLGGARFNVTFSPRTADIHNVVVTFNDEPVQGKIAYNQDEQHSPPPHHQYFCNTRHIITGRANVASNLCFIIQTFGSKLNIKPEIRDDPIS